MRVRYNYVNSNVLKEQQLDSVDAAAYEPNENEFVLWNKMTHNISIDRPSAPTTTQNVSILSISSDGMTAFEVSAATVSLLSVLVNVCIIIVLLIGPRAFRAPSFIFIGNLSCGSLINSIVILCIILTPSQSQWKQIANKGLFIASSITSINTLLFIAFERLTKIYDRGKYQKILKNGHAMVMLTASWLVSFGIFLLAPLFGWSCMNLCQCTPHNNCSCTASECSQSFQPFTKAYLAVTVAYFFTIFLITFVLYLLLRKHICKCFRLRRNGNMVIGQVPNYGPFVMIHRRRDISLSKTSLFVAAAYFVCYVPITVLFLLDLIGEHNLEQIFDYFLMPALMHPLISFVIYACRLPRMWSTFKCFAFAIWRRISCYKYTCRSIYSGSFQTKRPIYKLAREYPTQHQFSSTDSVQHTTNSSKTTIEKNNEFSTNFSTTEKQMANSLIDNSHAFNRKPLSSNSAHNSSIDNKNKQLAMEKFSHKTFLPEQKIRLGNGKRISRKNIEISHPFNPEVKITW